MYLIVNGHLLNVLVGLNAEALVEALLGVLAECYIHITPLIHR